MSDAPKLNERQRRFVEAYRLTGNKAESARRAGYSAHTAQMQGHRLMSNANIAAALAAAASADEERGHPSSERILAETDAVALSSVEHYRIDDDGAVTLAPGAPPLALQAVASIKMTRTTVGEMTTVKTELRLWDKVGALNLAMKRRGLLIDRQQVDHSGRVSIDWAKMVEPTAEGDDPVQQAIEEAGRE